MKLSVSFVLSVVGFVFSTSPTNFVASLSTLGRNLRKLSCSALANGNLGIRKVALRHDFGFSSEKYMRTCTQCFGKSKSVDDVVAVNDTFCEDNSIDSNYNNVNEEPLQRSVWNYLMDWFQGDFDNYEQVAEDRKKNLEPREGGGHEHLHCTLVPVTESTRLAAFFFDGNPDRIFRFRYYELTPPIKKQKGIEMILYTLHPDLEKLLKSQSSDPLNWPSLFKKFQPSNDEEPKVNRLINCEISWSFETDPVQHSYLADVPEGIEHDSSKSLHAVMVHGPAIVNSTIVPGMQIRIIDQLSLYQNTFYINDRGFDPVTDSFIYGNQQEVPYRLERVSCISYNSTHTRSLSSKDRGLERILTNDNLKWTMGPDFRSIEEYEYKLDSVGGPSVGMSKSSFKKGDATEQ